MRTIIRYLATCTVLMSSQLACDHASGPPSNGTAPAEFRILGPPGSTKIYDFTVADFLDGTQEPAVVPPDSIRPMLEFPESLYSRGVFVSGQEEETFECRQDTFFVRSTEQGSNLYSIIYNMSLHHATNGEYEARYTARYMLVDGNKICQPFGSWRDLVYQLPIQVGSVYPPSGSGAVTSIAAMDTVVTPAGRFAAFRVEVSGRWVHTNRETHWVNPDIGPVASEYHYYSTTTYPWDTTRTVQVHQIRRRDLVRIRS
jgi:hypothetical protein